MAPNAAFKSFDPDSDPDPDLPQPGYRDRLLVPEYGGQPLTTTYTYDPATGELSLIDYSDATPDITFAYDRLGRQKEIVDALGTRTFGETKGTPINI